MRSLSLDYLRIILCLLVIDYHYGKIFSAGPMAVVGFFVLAGYFLEREYEQSPNPDFSLFYKKKAIRLLPEYLITSVSGVIITFWFPSIYAVDFSQAEGSSYTLIRLLEIANNPSWFLTNLLFFTAAAPIFFCLHRSKRGIHLAFALAFAYCIALHKVYGGSGDWLYKAIQINITFFLGGMLARRMSAKRTFSPVARFIIAGLSALALTNFLFPARMALPIPYPFSRYICCICFMALIPALHCSSHYTSRFHGMVFWLSSLSYAMYLFHAPVKRISIYLLTKFTEYTEQQILTPWAYTIFLLLTVAAAAVFYHLKRQIINLLENK